MQNLRMIITVFLVGLGLGCLAPRVAVAQSEAYEKWRAQEQQKFQDYTSEQDRKFSDWLEEQWRRFEAMKGVVRDTAPKPEVVPVAPPPPGKPAPPPPRPRGEAPLPPKPIPPVDKTPKPIAPPPPSTIPGLGQVHSIGFFEQQVSLSLYDVAGVKPCPDVGEKSISAFWKSMSSLPQDSVVAQMRHYRRALGLNDWGYALLLQDLGADLFPGDENRAKLTVWYLLVKSGYDARVGFWENKIYLLVPAKQVLYESPYFDIKDRRYYLVTLGHPGADPKQMMIFEGNYPGSEAILDLSLTTMPAIGSKIFERKVAFDFDGQPLTVNMHYDDLAMNFLATMPLTDLAVYFTAPVSSDARQAVLDQLRPAVAGLSEQQAVNLLLCFVQTGFTYKTDEDQFGHEKYMFPEEVFLFPFSDCEDRSVLFRYLVKNLLGLEVVGLSYPGHISTAVLFRKDVVDGDSLMVGDRRFVICDPTYINAVAGMCMPQFRDVKPEVMSFD